MDIRNYKNIIPYGFLLFLLVAGLFSAFGNNPQIDASINSLAIPVFLFSISILLSKSNKYVRETVQEHISQMDRELNRTLNDDYSRAKLEKMNEYNLLCKKFIAVDKITRAINLFAILSFAICLLSVTGIVSLTSDCGYINVFSLALIFFDFFVLDEIMQRMVRTSIDKIHEAAIKLSDMELSDGSNER